jgi:hypothetical protein
MVGWDVERPVNVIISDDDITTTTDSRDWSQQSPI